MSEKGIAGRGTGRDRGKPDRRQAQRRRPNGSSPPLKTPAVGEGSEKHPITGDPETPSGLLRRPLYGDSPAEN